MNILIYFGVSKPEDLLRRSSYRTNLKESRKGFIELGVITHQKFLVFLGIQVHFDTKEVLADTSVGGILKTMFRVIIFWVFCGGPALALTPAVCERAAKELAGETRLTSYEEMNGIIEEAELHKIYFEETAGAESFKRWEQALENYFGKRRKDPAFRKIVEGFVVSFTNDPPEGYLPGDGLVRRHIRSWEEFFSEKVASSRLDEVVTRSLRHSLQGSQIPKVVEKPGRLRFFKQQALQLKLLEEAQRYRKEDPPRRPR